MSAGRAFILIFFIFIAGFILHSAYLGKVIYGDGIYYFSWVRSAVVDRDFDFTNEYTRFNAAQPSAPSGLPGNKYAPGAALLWTPLYSTAHVLIRGDGYGLPYHYAVGITGVLLAITGLVLLYDTLTLFFEKNVALYATGFVALGTNLWFYGSVDPGNSHAVSFFTSAVFLSYLFKHAKPDPFTTGLIIAAGAVTRTQDSVNGIIAFLRLPLRKLPLLILGFCIGFIPQFIVWQSVYGTIFTSPYLSEFEGFNFLKPNFIGVLFDPRSGWLLWTPAVSIALSGLLLLIRHKNIQIRFLIIPVLLQIYLVSAWSTWWQGASFSSRMLISTLPFLGFGFARSIQYIMKRWSEHIVRLVLVISSAVNACAIVYFLLRM